MTATQIESVLRQAPPNERLTLAARLIAEYHATLDAEEEREHLIEALERKRAGRR